MSLSRIVTHAEIVRVPDGGAIYLEDGAELTPLASERIAARRIEVHRGAAPQSAATLDAPELEEAARRVLERLGSSSPAAVEQVVSEVVAALGDRSSASGVGMPPAADYCAAFVSAERNRDRRRAVLTTSGRNQKGVVAGLTARIAELGGDILEISQTIVGDYFTMLLIIDISELTATFEQFKDTLTAAARERGVQAILMHEDLVSAMHRV